MIWRVSYFLALLFLPLASCASSIRYKIEPSYAIEDPGFARTMGNLLGPPLLPGNHIETLRNGDQIFPAMLAAIRAAQSTITFETFVYWRGSVGQDFATALCERARAGVKVHVMLDWLGAGPIDQRYLDQMKGCGVELVHYHPIHWYNLLTALSVDHRTHRKLLIVDGRVGFIGGVGIADEWSGRARDETEYRDNHYKVEGPAVAQLQAAFLDHWMQTTGRVLQGDGYFPALPKAGNQLAQIFKSSPHGGAQDLQLLYLLSIAAARDHIRLASAYFVPDHKITEALVDARRRGVTVEILVPGRHMDMWMVRAASRALWSPLLKAGVHIYEYNSTMYHVKQAIFDDRWALVGSSNLDPRSFHLNDEANLNVLDTDFAAEQIRYFEEDKKKAREMTYFDWTHRPVTEDLGAVVPSLLGSEL